MGMTENNEDNWLKEAFRNFDPEVTPGENFNERVLQKLTVQPSRGMQVMHALRVAAPIMFIIALAGILIIVFRGDGLVRQVLHYLPFLKPWHIFMAFIIIYFHFVRSVLILAFLYLKNGPKAPRLL